MSTERELSRLLRPIRGRLAVAVALQVVSSALVLAPLIGVAELARVLLAAPVDGSRAWTVVALSTALLGAGLALRGAADLVTHLADNAFTLHLRRRLAARLSAAPLGWFTDHASGRIKHAMADDVTAMHHLIGHAFTDLAAAITTPLVVFGYLATVDWRLTLVLLVPLPVFAVIHRQMMVDSAAGMAGYGRVMAELNSAVVEYVDGIGVVRSFGRAGQAHRAYRVAVDGFTAFFVGWARPLIRPETLSGAVIAPVSMTALALVAGAGFVAAGLTGPVDLLPFVLLGPGLSAPITALSSGALSLQLSRGAAARVLALLEIPTTTPPRDPLAPRGTTIELDGVGFSYDGTHPVLHGITTTLEPGTVTALVGTSGSGKSTLARLLLGFHAPDAGTVRLGGVALDRIAADTLYRHIGFVFQHVTLLRATIADNIALGRSDATREQVVAAARAANVDHVIDALPRGYDAVYGEDAQLSGGEAQRVAIARTLLLDPPVLVLDEPTSAADAESERAVQDALSTLAVRGGRPRTVLVIAHRLDGVTGADAILVLADGRLVEQGRHPELLAAGGHYANLWNTQHPAAAR